MSTTHVPSRFRRSAQRVDPEAERALRDWAFRNAAEEDQALEEYEALSFGVSGASASVLCSKPTDDELLGRAVR